ncbi:hypothetical protein T01_11752, partial [Trichinella spiralis]
LTFKVHLICKGLMAFYTVNGMRRYGSHTFGGGEENIKSHGKILLVRLNPVWTAVEEPPPLFFTHSQRAHLRTEACKRRFQKIKMDSFNPLPRSEHGNKYIFLIIDCFTK